VRVEEVVVGDEQGGEGHGAVRSFEAAGGADMVFVGTIESSCRFAAPANHENGLDHD
jgi:hypothetical protein